MSKEKFEAIASRWTDRFMHKDIKFMIDYARKQAERAQELEGENKQLKVMYQNNTGAGMNYLEQNKHYREVFKRISSVKNDEEFNPYAYMMLEIVEWAEEALEVE